MVDERAATGGLQFLAMANELLTLAVNMSITLLLLGGNSDDSSRVLPSTYRDKR